jgi:hypothetical protein
MSYAIDITPEAAGDLAPLPVQVSIEVERRLNELAQDPVGLSRPSHFPYPVNAQAFKFDYEFDDVQYAFHVLFKYGQNEQTLHILMIAVQMIGEP